MGTVRYVQALRERILHEAEESLKDYAGLQDYWASLRSCTVPQELFEEMKLQQAACNQVTNLSSHYYGIKCSSPKASEGALHVWRFTLDVFIPQQDKLPTWSLLILLK